MPRWLLSLLFIGDSLREGAYSALANVTWGGGKRVLQAPGNISLFFTVRQQQKKKRKNGW